MWCQPFQSKIYRESKLFFNHLIDELERTPIMAAKVLKAREAPLTSHRRTTNWLWEKVELVLQFDQQHKNRIEFDKQLKLKPAEGYLGTYNPKVAGAPATSDPKAAPKGNPKAGVPGAPAPKNANPKPKADKGKKVEAAPAPHAKAKAKPKAKAKGTTTTSPPPKSGATTPRSAEANRVANMTPAQKARTPCMFYAYNACKAKQCAFLHSATEKYKGPPTRTLSKPKSTTSVPGSMATIAAGTAAVPIVDAMPSKLTGAIPWLWDTAAGRHLIGKQALTPIKGPDNPTSQLLPIMSFKGCSGVGEGRQDKGGGERLCVKVCEKIVCMYVHMYVCMYIRTYVCMYVSM